jgi:predicted ester cyclase
VTIESGETIVGREAVGAYIGSMHTYLGDAHPVLKHLVIGEGIVVGEFDFVGTNTGSFEGAAPTGEELRLPYVVVYDVTESGIAELRAYLPIKKATAVFGPS